MSQSKDDVDSDIATNVNDTSSVVVSTKAGEIVAEATPCFTSQENSVQNRENERGDSLITSGDGDAPPSSSQNLAERLTLSGVDNAQSQSDNANSPMDGVTTRITGTIQGTLTEP